MTSVQKTYPVNIYYQRAEVRGSTDFKERIYVAEILLYWLNFP
jgi:hypothetical protein